MIEKEILKHLSFQANKTKIFKFSMKNLEILSSSAEKRLI